MKVLICHERFLFRFGADRLFMLTARGLRQRGHTVLMAAQRFDADVLSSVADRVIGAPSDCAYEQLDNHTAEWLEREWDSLFEAEGPPDVAIIGGWPFFRSVAVMRSRSIPIVFSDVGVVPSKGQRDGLDRVLENIRILRRRYLPDVSTIVPISDFLKETQSVPDGGGAVPVKRIYLGADHFASTLWRDVQLGLGSSGEALDLARSIKAKGCKVVLNLGRWEPGGYKASEVALQLLDSVVAQGTDVHLLALSPADEIVAPERLAARVHGLGFPDDKELLEIMELADLCVSVSQWEGFNLALAEAQWLQRPCLVFRVAAHPEVVSHPWRLCEDISDMTRKAIAVIERGDFPAGELAEADQRFRDRFTWDAHTQQYEGLLQDLTSGSRAEVLRSRLVIVHATNAMADTANSGIVRVTRRLGATLEGMRPVVFASWSMDRGDYFVPTVEQYEVLGAFNGPRQKEDSPVSPSWQERKSLDATGLDLKGAVLLLPEIVPAHELTRIRNFARARRMRVVGIYYDAIPTLRPELCRGQMVEDHAAYQIALASCDQVLAISQYSADCLTSFWASNGVSSGSVVCCSLPGQFASIRNLEPKDNAGGVVSMLCVSTLEPRKNHKRLLEAFRRVVETAPDVDWQLTLVGNRYAGADEIADFVERYAAADSRVRWLGVVDDETLHSLYLEADFTLYPSEIEGYGLPILESLWQARPCVCSNQGVMAELASDGGCLTVDVLDPAEISQGMLRLGTDAALRQRLTQEATQRGIRSWTEYADELNQVLDRLSERPGEVRERVTRSQKTLEDLLYPDCLEERWQMTDSERLAMTGLLARIRPQLSIEIGSYWGGSLSLLAQFSRSVISVDIEPETRGRCGEFANVAYLLGDSNDIVPELLRKLAAQNIAVEVVLIDADHTEEGVKRDIQPFLSYRPTKPLMVLLHDSFNPNCRRGMLTAGWHKSPYCHRVELDLVPGRIIQDGGPMHGEAWGGLALAYFLPEERVEELHIQQSAAVSYERLVLGLLTKD